MINKILLDLHFRPILEFNLFFNRKAVKGNIFRLSFVVGVEKCLSRSYPLLIYLFIGHHLELKILWVKYIERVYIYQNWAIFEWYNSLLLQIIPFPKSPWFPFSCALALESTFPLTLLPVLSHAKTKGHNYLISPPALFVKLWSCEIYLQADRTCFWLKQHLSQHVSSIFLAIFSAFLSWN